MRLLAYVTGSVNPELLLQNEYLAAEIRILRAKLPTKPRLSNPERATLAEIGKRLGRKVIGAVAWGHLYPCRYVLHDRGTKFCAKFRSTLAVGGVKNHSAPGEKSESERFCRTPGSLSQAGMSVKVDSVRRGSARMDFRRIQRSLSGERNHQGEGQQTAFSRCRR